MLKTRTDKCPICNHLMGWCYMRDKSNDSYPYDYHIMIDYDQCNDCHLFVYEDRITLAGIDYTPEQFERYLKLKTLW